MTILFSYNFVNTHLMTLVTYELQSKTQTAARAKQTKCNSKTIKVKKNV